MVAVEAHLECNLDVEVELVGEMKGVAVEGFLFFRWSVIIFLLIGVWG